MERKFELIITCMDTYAGANHPYEVLWPLTNDTEKFIEPLQVVEKVLEDFDKFAKKNPKILRLSLWVHLGEEVRLLHLDDKAMKALGKRRQELIVNMFNFVIKGDENG